MKKLSTAIMAGILFYACTNSNGAGPKDGHSPYQQKNNRSYSCPMHPEVKGGKGEECPECGMQLEPSQAQDEATSYFMQTEKDPEIHAGKPVNFSFIPRIRGRESEPVVLDIEHEKKIHLIVVSNDLSWFDHIHPESVNDGSYCVKEKFPAPGQYTLFADYKPSGVGHVVDKIPVEVRGNPPAPVKFTNEKWEGDSGQYGFELKPAVAGIVTHQPVNFAGIIKKDGKEINANSLDNYLGAKAHFVMISLNEREYLHVHPHITNGRFDLQTQFKKAGIYRAWVQFNAEGKLHTIDFTINVLEDQKKTSVASQPMEHHVH